jgi:hypothetical protein
VRPLTLLAAALSIVVAAPAAGVPGAPAAHGAERSRPARADLVVPRVTVDTDGGLTASVTVRNRAPHGRAARSSLLLVMSRDTVRSADDGPLGSVRTPGLRPRTSRVLSTSLALPTGASGTWYVLACADAERQVRERKERNNCRASAPFTPGESVTVDPTDPTTAVPPVRIAARATAGARIDLVTFTKGTCEGLVCSIRAGEGSVTFRYVTDEVFLGWGGDCHGSVQGDLLVFDRPTVASECVANVGQAIPVRWSVAGARPYEVTGSASPGSCSRPGLSGECKVTRDGTVRLVASGQVPEREFLYWSCRAPVRQWMVSEPTLVLAPRDLTAGPPVCTATYRGA